MRARPALALALALLAAPAAAQQDKPSPVVPQMLAPADGYDVDAVLRRAREQEERYNDRRYPAYQEQQQRAGSTRELDLARTREHEARRTYDAERNRTQLDSMTRGEGTAAQRTFERETLHREKLDAERARRSADDAIPSLWRR